MLDKCIKCVDDCASCSSATACDRCKRGFTLVNSTCIFNYLNSLSTQQCPYGCSSCTFSGTTSFCLKLYDGFAYGPNSSIVQCSSSCETCDSNNPSFCLSCYSGALNSGVCSSCNDANCQECSENKFTCSSCKPSFILNSGVCVACASNC